MLHPVVPFRLQLDMCVIEYYHA
ncbi:uncharacterized protein FFNC_05036 [Fusarium fujikuroi]|nr:uncharacterized protein FFNC_05036 [Fusarium fujikuroi]